MIRIFVFAAAGLIAALPALAQNLPPVEGKPLSQILLGVENSLSPRAITDVEWEDDGYWDIDYRTADNRRARVRIDPITGENWTRRR